MLTERVEHLEQLAQRLSSQVQHAVVLHGGLGEKALRNARARLAERSASGGCVILATGKYIGEGFDDPQLDTLFLTLPEDNHENEARQHEARKRARYTLRLWGTPVFGLESASQSAQ